ncbi:hypothetical protein EW146_g9130 [Bondarzewia mesenterica]|uniref:Uncharacterized protein n=1 Tax=Bondarzewia mesenterica TaxID=1095465 RepID=A0A4S4L8Y5_9AGAM|nr:hypothetical protein EW146_g9130 [Bondarzewia mesenterica]
MSAARRLVDSPDDTVELDRHKFGSENDGARGCISRASRTRRFLPCTRPTMPRRRGQHITKARMRPFPDREKDWVSHRLYWARLGFKDPYSREEQTEFSKWLSFSRFI